MRSSSLKSKFLGNLGANAYGQLITIASQLVSIPFFLHYWGVDHYGEWLIMSAIPAYLSLSDIGFASVAANDMTMRVAKGDQQGALEVYQSIWGFICAVSLLIGGIAIYLILSLAVGKLFSLRHISANQASQVLFILTLYVFVGLQSGVLNAGFRAAGRYAYGTVLNNTIRLFEWVMVMVALALGGGVLVVAMATLIVRLLGTAVLWITLRKQAPWLHLGFHVATLRTIRMLFKPAIAFMAFPLGLALSLQGMVLSIGILLGPTAVAIFSTYRTLARLLVQIITMINQAIWPEISVAYGAGEMDTVNKLHHRGSAFNFWIALVIVTVLGLMGEWIIGVWTHYTFQSHPVLLGLLLATSFLNVLWQTSWTIMMATNMHQNLSIVFIAASAGGLAGSSLTIPLMGINGSGMALVIAELPLLYLAIHNALSLLKDNWLSYAKAVISNPLKKESVK